MVEHLQVAVAKGSLSEKTLSIFNEIGVKMEFPNRIYTAKMKSSNSITGGKMYRPELIPLMILHGKKTDFGITGEDFLVESGCSEQIAVVEEFNYSKNALSPVRIAVYRKKINEESSDERMTQVVNSSTVIDEPWVRVLSEYPEMTKKRFKQAIIHSSSGTTEAAVGGDEDVFHYGVGVEDSGFTLEQNGLEVVEVLMSSPVVMVARKDDSKMDQIKHVASLFRGVLRAEGKRKISVNVPPSLKERVLSMIPSVRSPNVGVLANGWFSVETVIKLEQLMDTLFSLKKLGIEEEGIVTQKINICL